MFETNFINGQGTMDPDDPYQVAVEKANNQIYENFIDNDGAIPLTHFDISDFFEDPRVLLFKFCLSFEDIWIILLKMHVLLIVPQLTQFM